ncbi:NAD(P)H-dependent oxidoreductase [Marinivivus vitaminiproducens]|uniref:NAD(P)H-dependent oxidoreductase n=1 Tax=Marinivivus vitaminiproducens TaxID=3035935 RepID=UPI002798F0B1|nr:NAD(P)-dependent oxidoreductase [Geminicoccaceae bacterium SCSIO 64248]
MILVDSALRRREEEGRPIRVGMVGAGFMGSGIALQILTSVPGMRLAAIANRGIDAARACFAQAGVEARTASTTSAIADAVAAGQPVVTDDPLLVARAPGIDIVFEVTGSIEFAAQAVLAAIEAGKHVVHMNAELDGTVGPILKRRADAAGVIYSFSDGDQPGVEMNLYRFVAGIGVTPVLCGNIKGLHDPYRNPETQAAFAARWGQSPAMVASFADGTKISFEQAIVANGTGFRVAKRGMVGPDFSGGDPHAPLVPLEETIASFAPYLDPDGPGLVDYVVGARPGPGVFVIGTIADERQRHYLNLYKLGAGPYYVFYTPYHLCHFEAPSSIARAVVFADTVLAPIGGPRVGVIALAKRDLEPGTVIGDFGGFEVYGVAENIDAIRTQSLLPIGLALGSRVKRAVVKDTPMVLDDVVRPEGRLVDRLYDEQERVFAPDQAKTEVQ